jgi:hypothetical protein
VSEILTAQDFRAFVKESNRIEGITRAPSKRELDAHVLRIWRAE